MDKGQYATSAEYEAALRNQQYAGHEPIDSNDTGKCLHDAFSRLGNMPETTGDCPLAPECNYANDKSGRASGFCLKQAVGVEIK